MSEPVSHTIYLAVRFWNEMIARPSGSLAFRFILQPSIASALAIRDGIKDARFNCTPYFPAILNDPTQRRRRLSEGIRAVSRALILAGLVDMIYQFVELRGFRPLQMVCVAFVLAFLPYLIVRGLATHIARDYIESHGPPPRPGR